MYNLIGKFAVRWAQEKDAVAAVEAALVFPLMLTLLLGTFDLGNGILTNQKVIRASQVAGDLITRERTVDDAGLEEAISASMLALVPESTSTFGIDIVSIRFDDLANPTIVWRETRNMTADPYVLDRVAPLAEAGNGVVVVLVRYDFHPIFGDFVIGDIGMQEIAFTRGRKSAVVNRV